MAEIEVQLRQDTGWTELPHDYGTQFANFRARKINGIVYVEIPRAVAGGPVTTITTLPTGMRPSAEQRFVAKAWGGDTYEGWIRTNGTIVINAPVDTVALVCTILPFVAA